MPRWSVHLLYCLPLLVALPTGCGVWHQVTGGRAEYELYRQSRVGESPELRLKAAWAYLKTGAKGPWRQQTEQWFYPAERRFYASARMSLDSLVHYLRVLPDGPHLAQARARIAELKSVQAFEAKRNRQRLTRDRALLSELQQAQQNRKRLIATFSAWVEHALSVQTWGALTSELPHEFIHAYRLAPPEATCEGDTCQKRLEFDFLVPHERSQVARHAILNVTLRLEKGGVVEVALGGPRLFSRLSEALTLEQVDSEEGQERIEALARVLQLVQLLVEGVAPEGRCGRQVVSPDVLVRSCDGRQIRLAPAGADGEEDRLVVRAEEPEGAGVRPEAPALPAPPTP